MKIPNSKYVPRYWGEGQKNEYHWYKKKDWKRILRKLWIKTRLNDHDKE